MADHEPRAAKNCASQSKPHSWRELGPPCGKHHRAERLPALAGEASDRPILARRGVSDRRGGVACGPSHATNVIDWLAQFSRRTKTHKRHDNFVTV
jgi:hypothetical protein